MYYNDTANTLNNTVSMIGNMQTYNIVGLVIGIMASILIYFLFINVDKKYDSKFINSAKKFLNFETNTIEPLLIISYIYAAVYFFIVSINLINVDFLSFIQTLLISQVLIRIIFEIAMLSVRIYKNTSEINKKMK